MEGFFLKILNMSVTAGYVILAVLLIRRLLRRAPKKYAYLLWSVVLFRLICPVSVSSVISIFGISPFDMTAAQRFGPAVLTYVPADIGRMAEPKVTVGIPAANVLISGSLPPATPAASVNPLQIFLAAGTVIWCVGMAALILYSLVSYIRINRAMATAVWLSGRVRQSDKISSPFVLGFIRPRIYIPFRLSEDERDYILLHEEYHIKRGDHLIKPLFFSLLVLHWFNPLVWLAYTLMSRDMEMSCDEYVLHAKSRQIAISYSTSLLSFASNRRFPAAGPLCFGESDIKERIRNALRYKPSKRWVTAAAAVLCAIVIVSCAVNPRGKDTPPEEGVPYGNYIFQSQVYMNPLSSFFAFDGYIEYYTLTEKELIITDSEGNPHSYPAALEKAEFDEQAFKEGFMMDFSEIDISRYKNREQYDLTGSRFRIYVMDDEIWLARVHSGNANTGEYVWSIYRIKPYDGELPKAEIPDESAKEKALSLLEEVFQRGARIAYQDMDKAGVSLTPTVRDIALDNDWFLERYKVLFDCNWENSDALRAPGRGDVCLILGDGGSGFWFFLGSDSVTYMEKGKPLFTWRAGGESGTLPDAILSEFSGYEASYKNIIVPDENYDFEQAADAFLKEYGNYLQNMTPENISRITDFQVLEREVYLTREGDDSIFGFDCAFALKPVIYDTAFWWAGNTAPGTGELEGYLTMYRQLRLEREKGFWRCTDMGTGGLSLD